MYTFWAVTAVVAAVAVEVLWARTGLLRRPAYWVTIAITWGFQVPVDGWLTKLSAPIVIYNAHDLSGVRFPWDIPVEDFAYGFALVTLTLTLWVKAGEVDRSGLRRRREGRAAGSRYRDGPR